MHFLRTLFVAASLILVVAGLSAACTVQSAFVSGKLVENGGFEIVTALDSRGNALDGTDGKVFSKVESAEGVVLPASASGELVYLVADLDFDNDVLRVASSTQCAATAQASVASAKNQAASASGCCAAGKSASTKAASAQVASAPKASVSNASSCGSWKAASSPASCSASKANVEAASAGSGCSATNAASAEYAGGEGACGADCTKACCSAAAGDYSLIVFNVSGMTCGGCASKIESAVAALAMEGIESCEIDVAGGKAVIRASGKVCTKTLESAITGAGFTAEIVDAGAVETENAKS
jgi:copper chaperone CopZ